MTDAETKALAELQQCLNQCAVLRNTCRDMLVAYVGPHGVYERRGRAQELRVKCYELREEVLSAEGRAQELEDAVQCAKPELDGSEAGLGQ